MAKKLAKQISMLLIVVLLFASFNVSLYFLLTRRLSNNFSGTDQAKQIDVAMFLPHESASDLPKIDSSLQLTDDLPILDGAAALVPVYAAIIHNVYPEGCVTYDGGSFSDDNYYGENFAAVVNKEMQIPASLQKRGIQLQRAPEMQINYIGFSFADPLLGKNENLRKAISLAFNRDVRIEYGAGKLYPAHGPVPPEHRSCLVINYAGLSDSEMEKLRHIL